MKMRINIMALLVTLLPLVIGHVGAESDDFAVDATARRDNVWVALMDPTLTFILCGASMIDDKQALTLARCVRYKKKEDYKLAFYAYPGIEALSYHGVDSVLFQSENASADNDVAIVNIVEPIRTNNVNVPVCLPFRHTFITLIGQEVRALGWNRLSMFGRSHTDVMVDQRMIVINGSVCNKMDIRPGEMDSCNELMKQDEVVFYGGEPVFWKCPVTKMVVQMGIVSSGIPYTNDNIFMVRTGSFLGWIKEHVNGGKFLLFK